MGHLYSDTLAAPAPAPAPAPAQTQTQGLWQPYQSPDGLWCFRTIMSLPVLGRTVPAVSVGILTWGEAMQAASRDRRLHEGAVSAVRSPMGMLLRGGAQ